MAAAEDRTVRVLLVDRDSSEIVATRFLLTRVTEARFVVEEAASLSAALQRLARGGVDLLLMDSKTAGSPVLEDLGTLRSRFPDMPVVLLAGAGDKQWVPVALQMGAKDCIAKDNISSNLLGRILLRHAKKA